MGSGVWLAETLLWVHGSHAGVGEAKIRHSNEEGLIIYCIVMFVMNSTSLFQMSPMLKSKDMDFTSPKQKESRLLACNDALGESIPCDPAGHKVCMEASGSLQKNWPLNIMQ